MLFQHRNAINEGNTEDSDSVFIAFDWVKSTGDPEYNILIKVGELVREFKGDSSFYFQDTLMFLPDTTEIDIEIHIKVQSIFAVLKIKIGNICWGTRINNKEDYIARERYKFKGFIILRINFKKDNE